MKKKYLGIIILTVMCIMVFSGCSEPISGEPVAYDSADELSEAVGFEVLEPASLPEGYIKSGYFSLDDSVAEILYMSGANQIIYAMSKVKNIECDIEDYDEIVVTEIDGHKVELMLKDGYVLLGVMTKGEYTYSIYAPSGLSEGEFELIAKGFGNKPAENLSE